LIVYVTHKDNAARPLFSTLIWVVLLINILEAVVKDLATGQMLNMLNGSVGLLLMLILPSRKKIEVGTGAFKRLEFDTSMNWVLGYTFWNITFVYLNFGEGVFRHIIILAIPLAIAAWNRKLWLQARLHTLSVFVFSYMVFPDWWSNINSPFITSEVMASMLVVLSTGWCAQLLLYRLVEWKPGIQDRLKIG